MATPAFVVPGPKEWPELDRVLLQSFDIPPEWWPVYKQRVGEANFRAWRQDGRVVGGLVRLPFGQFWGGRSVRMAGLAVVGTAPEHRGTGVAAGLLRATLAELRAEGCPLSALYPATQVPYRKVGFEQAGNKYHWSIELDRIGLVDRSCPATAVPTDTSEPYRDTYQAQACITDGFVDRPAHAWERILRPRGATSWGYVFGDPGAPEGHLVFKQVAGTTFRYDLEIQDFVARTPRALRRGWTLLADHRSLAARAKWIGPASDPRAAVLPEQTARVDEYLNWMLRLVDLPAAITARGWRGEGVVELDVTDAVLPENAGRWWLTVSGGEGRLERPSRLGSDPLSVDIRGLAALYAGHVSVATAAALGWCAGSPRALEAATAVFPAGTPWMADHF